MSGAPLEAVEGVFKKPILIGSGFQIAVRRSNDGDLIRRENPLTEGIFAVSLIKGTTRCNSHTSEEAERILSKDWSKPFALCPHSVFMISKNDDARLCPKGLEVLILLDSKDTHCGNGPRSSFFLKSPIFAECNLFICIEFLNATLLFEETLQPDLTIGMRISKCLEEG